MKKDIKVRLPIAPLERLLKDGGAKRVSRSAAEEMSSVLGDIGLIIAQEAAVYARHAGRKTVLAEDVKLAAKSR